MPMSLTTTLVVVVVFSLVFHRIQSQNVNEVGTPETTFVGNETHCFPERIQLYEEEQTFLHANCSELNNTYLTYDKYDVLVDDNRIATLIDVKSSGMVNESGIGEPITFKGIFLGRTSAKVYYRNPNIRGSDEEDGAWVTLPELKISVIRKARIIDHLFVGFVTILMMIAYIGMGCAVDIGVVKEVLKKPVAPLIGFLSQYIVMPLCAFGVVKLFGLNGGIALGFFASGCAPGGGASNMYTYLLGGDSSLSVTMTLISTIASLGMFPLWLHTLGRMVYDTHGMPLRVPFTNIFTSLAVMIIPLSIGAVIKIKRPLWAELCMRLMRPFFAIVIILLITVGIWANLYLFQLISPWLILGACLLSYTGFLLGGFLAYICRLKFSRIIAVAIETGVQNTGLPILLLKFSLPQPDADLSVVGPVTVAMFMPIPLWIAITIFEIRKKCKASSGSNLQQVATESEIKTLKVPEINGGPNHVVEVAELSQKVKFNRADLEQGDMKQQPDGTEVALNHLTGNSGDANCRQERF